VRQRYCAAYRLRIVEEERGDLATYAYDPLDRLRLADDGSTRTRFRYVGLTGSAAQTIDDTTGSVIRNIGTGWTGERLLDWTGTTSNIRYHGTNAHHDTVWTASSTGTVSATLRYDPWGSLTTSTGTSLPEFRFQGSWFDATTNLSWVITRWYAPGLGRFVSEDSLQGDPADPPSRHLYAYGSGEPIGRWDLDGRFWYRWRSGDTTPALAWAYLGSSSRWRAIINTNRNRIFAAGACLWIPRDVWYPTAPGTGNCPSNGYITGDILNRRDSTVSWYIPDNTKAAAQKVFGDWRRWYLLSSQGLWARTQAVTRRSRDPAWYESAIYIRNEAVGDAFALRLRANPNVHGVYFSPAHMALYWGAAG
jgi:RHS repeat-associated protein